MATDAIVTSDNPTPRKMRDNGDGSHTPYVAVDSSSGQLPSDVNLEKVGGSAISLGQAAKAGSLPVALASDDALLAALTAGTQLTQLADPGGRIASNMNPASHVAAGIIGNALLSAPTFYPDTFSFSSVTAGTVYDLGNFRAIAIQLTALYTGTTPTITFQCSNDGSIWVSFALMTVANAGVAPVTSATATGAWFGTVPMRYFRINMTGTYTSGTTTGNLLFSTFDASPNVGGFSTVNNTPTNVNAIALTSAASTNATSSKASAGNLYTLFADNMTASTKWLKLYNKASAPTVGTDVPVETIPIPANSFVQMNYGAQGLRFTTGIAFAITGAQAVSDTTAVAAGDVHVHGGYI